VSSILVVPAPRPSATVRLVCFPFAGGGPSVYRPWTRALPSWVELAVVALPGRESRFAEPPLQRVEDVVEAVLDALAPRLDRPWALFGHSLGGLLAFEVARGARDRGLLSPRVLFASAAPPPRAERLRALAGKSDAELVEILRELGGTPEEVLREPELMELALPVLRTDFAIGDAYAYSARPPLTCPIVALSGEEDRYARPDLMRGWSEETTGGFEAHRLPGDHFFLGTARSDVLAVITSVLASRG
jgi:medium-chain acyl-[acyl-carrier-protein] hydrolase